MLIQVKHQQPKDGQHCKIIQAVDEPKHCALGVG